MIGEELRTLAAWIERYGAAFYVGGASPGDDADALRGVAERIKASIGQYGESRESEWRREVSEGETVLGFLEWLEHRIEETGDDAPDPCSEHVHVADPDCEACNAEGDARDGARASADPECNCHASEGEAHLADCPMAPLESFVPRWRRCSEHGARNCKRRGVDEYDHHLERLRAPQERRARPGKTSPTATMCRRSSWSSTKLRDAWISRRSKRRTPTGAPPGGSRAGGASCGPPRPPITTNSARRRSRPAASGGASNCGACSRTLPMRAIRRIAPDWASIRLLTTIRAKRTGSRKSAAKVDADRLAHETKRAAGLEWLATCDGARLDDTDANDPHDWGLTYADLRAESERRAKLAAGAVKAAQWARCRAAIPEGATIVDDGAPSTRGVYGRDPGAIPTYGRTSRSAPGTRPTTPTKGA